MSRSFRLGLFIAGTLVILGTGVFLIGSKQLQFHSTYRINAQFRNVAGLQGGADVRIGGIHEGTVRRIGLPSQPDGEVTVAMDLDRSTRNIVNKDSVAFIKSEGLLGDKYVEISFGSKGGAGLKDGDTIATEAPTDIADLVKKVDQILGTTNQAAQNVEGTTRNLEAVSSRINSGAGTIGKLVNDSTLYQRANEGVTAFDENMEALKHNILLRGFFRRRGYEDAAELANHRISRLPPGPALKSYTYEASKLFDKDSAKLKDQKALSEAGEFLAKNQFGLAVVAASANMNGDSEKSQTLSAARAMVVRDYLVSHFRTEDTRIKTLPLGKGDGDDSNAKVQVLAYPVQLSGRSSSRSR